MFLVARVMTLAVVAFQDSSRVSLLRKRPFWPPCFAYPSVSGAVHEMACSSNPIDTGARLAMVECACLSEARRGRTHGDADFGNSALNGCGLAAIQGDVGPV
jgi:hypothetical protein